MQTASDRFTAAPTIRGLVPPMTLAPVVHVVWRRAQDPGLSAEKAARAIAETVVLQRQPTRAEPSPLAHRDTGRNPTASDGALPVNVPHHRVVGFELEVGAGQVRLVRDDGVVLTGGTLVRADGPGMVDGMSTASPQPRRRKPAVINVRPGASGQPRQMVDEDPTDGLERFGQVIWHPVAGGAQVGVLEMNPEGNAILAARLSAEDRNERLVNQLEPILALSDRHAEILRPRFAVLSIKMSGTREVRHERAGAPPAGVLERDDMLIVDRAIKERWLEQIVWRDGDRIARDLLPGEMLLRRWQKNGVGLWLSTYGRQMDYETDWMALTAMMMVSAAERRNATRRMRAGMLTKGPLAGNGWLGPVPFGFIRDKRTRRLMAEKEGMKWINRAFEIADPAGRSEDESVGLSTRQVAELLANEGCPFDHEHIRRVLQSPIYSTGEHYCYVGGKKHGVAVLQEPPENPWPVPRDRFARVQEVLALRKGRSDRTPLGEFLFNTVECVHAQCEDSRRDSGFYAQIGGYILKDGNPDHRRLRHAPFVPACCKHVRGSDRRRFVWERDTLERPVVEAIRDLVRHPELQRQLADAMRVEQALPDDCLSEDEEFQLESEIADLHNREAALVDRHTRGELSPEEWKILFQPLQSRRRALQARLDSNRERAASSAGPPSVHSQDDRTAAFLTLLTVETPTDPLHKALRARLFSRCISRIVIDDDGYADIIITIEGPLVPPGGQPEDLNPNLAGADLIDLYTETIGDTRSADTAYLGREIETDTEARAAKAVSRADTSLESLLLLPSGAEVDRRNRDEIASTSWRHRGGVKFKPGDVAWRITLKIVV